MKLQAGPGRPQLGGVFLALVAHLLHVGVAEQGVVVEGHLGVEGDHVALGRDHQGIDLGQAAVLVEEHAGQGGHHRLGLGGLLGTEAQSIGQPPRLERQQPSLRLNRHLEDFLRAAGRDLFDLDAALGTGHHDRQAHGPVHDHAEVDFASDVGRVLHQHLADALALFAGLLGDQRMLEPMTSATWPTSSRERMNLTPPQSLPLSLKRPLPRPPAWICALSTTGPPIWSNAFWVSAGEEATMPRGMAAPAAAKALSPGIRGSSSRFSPNGW